MNFYDAKDSWKTRNAALDELSSIVTKNDKILFNKELSLTFKGLRKILTDSNKNLIMKALRIIGQLGQGLGVKVGKESLL